MLGNGAEAGHRLRATEWHMLMSSSSHFLGTGARILLGMPQWVLHPWLIWAGEHWAGKGLCSLSLQTWPKWSEWPAGPQNLGGLGRVKGVAVILLESCIGKETSTGYTSCCLRPHTSVVGSSPTGSGHPIPISFPPLPTSRRGITAFTYPMWLHPLLHLSNWVELELNTSSTVQHRFSFLAGDGLVGGQNQNFGWTPKSSTALLLGASGQVEMWFSAVLRKGNSSLFSAFSKADPMTPLCPGNVFILQTNIDPHAKNWTNMDCYTGQQRDLTDKWKGLSKQCLNC